MNREKRMALWFLFILGTSIACYVGKRIIEEDRSSSPFAEAEVRTVRAIQANVNNIWVEQRRMAVRETAEYVSRNMATTPSFSSQAELMAISLGNAGIDGLILEFGTGAGNTTKLIASLVRPELEIHGFDSWEGLPEPWRVGYQAGAFAIPMPTDLPSNVMLHKGWFKNSIPEFKKQYPGPIAFMHMDADLHSSTKDVFDLLGDRIVDGTIIQFDEFFNYPGWRDGEAKAFEEFVTSNNITFSFIGYNVIGEQVAVKIGERK